MNSYKDSCGDCSPVYNIATVENLQDKIDKKLALMAKNENKSKRNDLGYKVNTQKFKNLNRYNKILDGVVECSPCYQSQDIESIFSLVKKELV